MKQHFVTVFENFSYESYEIIVHVKKKQDHAEKQTRENLLALVDSIFFFASKEIEYSMYIN